MRLKKKKNFRYYFLVIRNVGSLEYKMLKNIGGTYREKHGVFVNS